MNLTKLETVEAIAVLTIVMANKIILNLPKAIISATGSSAWLTTLLIILLSFLLGFLFIKLLKKFPGEDLLDISKFLGGPFLQKLIGILYLSGIILIISLIIRDFSETLKIIYFNESPIIFIILFFIGSGLIANKFGLKAIAKTTLILAPIIFLSILVVLIAPAPNFVFQRLLPILGYGAKETFFSGLSNLYGFVGFSYIFFLPRLLKNSNDVKKITLISLGIAGIFLLLSVCCLLLVFSFILDTNESLSLYLLTRIVNYGDFIQGANTIFVVIWILSVIAYVSITIFFIIYIFKRIAHLKDTSSANLCICSILLGTTILLQNYGQFMNTMEYAFKYMSLILVDVITPIILIAASIKKEKR